MLLQWNPSKADTIGTKDFVLYREVSLTQGQPRPYQDRGQGCGLRVNGQYLTVLLSVWGDSTILAHFRAKIPSERTLTLFAMKTSNSRLVLLPDVAKLSGYFL